MSNFGVNRRTRRDEPRPHPFVRKISSTLEAEPSLKLYDATGKTEWRATKIISVVDVNLRRDGLERWQVENVESIEDIRANL